MLRRAFTVAQARRPGARLLVGPRLPRPLRERRARVRPRARPAVHRLQQDRALHDGRRHGPAAPGRERDRVRAGLGPVRRRRAHLGLGLGQGRSGAPRRGCASTSYVTYADGTEEVVAVRRLLEGQHRRADALRQLLPRRDLRRAARDRRTGTQPGFDDAALGGGARGGRARGHAARAGARAHPRGGGRGRPGTRTEPAPGVFVYDVGQNLTGWAEIRVRAPAGTAVEIFYSREARTGRPGEHRRQRAGRSASSRPTTTSRSGAGDERWAPRFTLQGLPVRPAQRARRAAAARRRLRVAVERVQQVRSGLARTSTFESGQRARSTGSTATRSGRSREQPRTASSPTRRSTRRTPGRATRSSRRAPPRSCSTPSGSTGRCSRTCATRRRREGEVPLPGAEQPELRLRRQARTSSRSDCCGATPAWDAFWFVIPWEGYHALRRPARARADLSGDAEVPRRVDPALDGQGRRRARAHADLGPRRLGAARRTCPPSTRSPPPRTTRTSRASPPTRRARWARTPTPRATTRCSRGSAPTSTRASWARTASTARRRASRSRRPRRSCPLAFGLVPDEQRAALAARLADDITNARGGNAYVGVLGARYVLPVLTATGHARRRLRASATQTDEPSWGYWTDVARLHVARRALAGRHPLAQPPHVRRHRAVDLRGPRRHAAARARATARSSSSPRSRDRARPRGGDVRERARNGRAALAAGRRRPRARRDRAAERDGGGLRPRVESGSVREGGRPADKADGVRFQRMVEAARSTRSAPASTTSCLFARPPDDESRPHVVVRGHPGRADGGRGRVACPDPRPAIRGRPRARLPRAARIRPAARVVALDERQRHRGRHHRSTWSG